MAEPDKMGKPGRRVYFGLTAIAVAVVLVGIGAAYVTRSHSGRDAVIAAADAGCAGREQAARALGQAATGELAAMQASNPPSSVAALSFAGPGGKPMTLADLKGRTVLVNLWAAWCAPCRAEMPALDRLQAQMGGDRFQVVAIDVDTGPAARPDQFLAEIGVKSLARYRDASMGVFNALKKKGLAFGLPVTVLVDRKGCELAAMNGPADWTSGDARRFIEAALKASI